MVRLIEQRDWDDQKAPINADRPSPTVATQGECDPQWLKDLLRDGFVLVKDVITRDKTAEYVSKGEDWLEGFNFGYKRDDPTTWDVEKLPKHTRGGLYSHYSFPHAQFVWDCKAEPKIVELFERLWGTEELTVSFDGGSLAVPLPANQVEENAAPWPHLPNGPNDGGLMVMRGSANLFAQYFEEHKDEEPEGGYRALDGYNWTEKQLKWFEERGCEWVKPARDPGDFVIWDSRTIHYGAAPKEANKRFAIYICYKPDAYLLPEQREMKVEAFNRGYCTSHDPTDFMVKDDMDIEWNQHFPYGRPVLSEKTQKAVGLLAY